MADALAILDDRIRSLEERLDELRALRAELAGDDAGKVAAPSPPGEGEADADDEPTGGSPEDDGDDSCAADPVVRSLPIFSRTVPELDSQRVAAVSAVLDRHGPMEYIGLLGYLPGWRTGDLGAVLKGHPEQFRAAVGQTGKVWELAGAPTVAIRETEPPVGLMERCRAIAAALADGPLYPVAIYARLRWPKSVISATLNRQQTFDRPWFENENGGWALTGWAREQLSATA
jgi:hypothetical protein